MSSCKNFSAILHLLRERLCQRAQLLHHVIERADRTHNLSEVPNVKRASREEILLAELKNEVDVDLVEQRQYDGQPRQGLETRGERN